MTGLRSAYCKAGQECSPCLLAAGVFAPNKHLWQNEEAGRIIHSIMKDAASLPGATLLPRSSALARLFLCSCLILSGLSVVATAQTTYPKTVYLPPTTSQSKPMSVDDVIKLSKAGLSDDLIIQQIKKKGQRFDLSGSEEHT